MKAYRMTFNARRSVLAIMLAAILLQGCNGFPEYLDSVSFVLDTAMEDLPVGTTVTVYGNPHGSISPDGTSSATFVVTDSAVVEKHHVYRALRPVSSELKWLPKVDAALFYAVAPGRYFPDGTQGRFEDIMIPSEQTATKDPGVEGLFFAEPSTALSGEPARLKMFRAFTLVEVHLDTTALRQGRILESASLTSTVSSLCGEYDVLAAGWAFRCPGRTADNARVTMTLSGARRDDRGYVVLPFVLLPQTYSQLALELRLRDDDDVAVYSTPISSPSYDDAVKAQSKRVFHASVPWIGGVTHPEGGPER